MRLPPAVLALFALSMPVARSPLDPDAFTRGGTPSYYGLRLPPTIAARVRARSGPSRRRRPAPICRASSATGSATAPT